MPRALNSAVPKPFNTGRQTVADAYYLQMFSGVIGNLYGISKFLIDIRNGRVRGHADGKPRQVRARSAFYACRSRRAVAGTFRHCSVCAVCRSSLGNFCLVHSSSGSIAGQCCLHGKECVGARFKTVLKLGLYAVRASGIFPFNIAACAGESLNTRWECILNAYI